MDGVQAEAYEVRAAPWSGGNIIDVYFEIAIPNLTVFLLSWWAHDTFTNMLNSRKTEFLRIPVLPRRASVCRIGLGSVPGEGQGTGQAVHELRRACEEVLRVEDMCAAASAPREYKTLGM